MNMNQELNFVSWGKYIDIIKDMYDEVVANVRTCGGITSDFSITIG